MEILEWRGAVINFRFIIGQTGGWTDGDGEVDGPINPRNHKSHEERKDSFSL